ncbi:GATA-type zinc finger protein 1-like [Stegodyphus dumicola]|uniref:GATA-type zinc finger protein 1-like n=1 Tax=Stegodyphus dumicola TaxID=202533 RepID=UPI0015A8EEF7|nr:GATA-type zinc finger protein 1-like [Stegodyphus dumicola]
MLAFVNGDYAAFCDQYSEGDRNVLNCRNFSKASKVNLDFYEDKEYVVFKNIAIFSSMDLDFSDSFSECSENSQMERTNDSNDSLTSLDEVSENTKVNEILGISRFNETTPKNEIKRVTNGGVFGSKKRKSSTPCRSSPPDDPSFRGVTITMENKFIDSEWKLVIHSTFSLSPKKKKKRVRTYVDSSEEEEMNTNYYQAPEEKHCASCSAKKTPLWRDAEDGTPLCNACGIRYKKYKLRCGTCWHIPKKDEFSPTCRFCGSFYQYVSLRR